MITSFKKTLFVFFFLFFEFILFSQNEIKKDSLSQIVNNHSNDTVGVNALNLLSELYLYQNIDSALYFSKKALKVSESLFYKKGLADSYRNLGRINTISGHYKESLDYLYKALKENENLHDTLSSGKNYASIAIIHYYRHDLDKAMLFYKKAINIYTKEHAIKELGRVYNNIGLIYSDLNNLDTAQYYFNQTIDISKQTGDKKIEISAIGNSARLFLIKGEFENAVKKFHELIEKTDSVSDKSTICVSYLNICAAYINMAQDNLKNKNFADSSLKYNMMAMKFAEKLNSNSLKAYSYDNFAKIYKMKKDYKSAFESLEKYSILNDSMFNKEKTEAIANIETKYETEKKQLIIENLQKEKQKDLIIIQKKNTIILITIIGFLIVLVLLLFLFKLYRSKNQTLKLLDEKNKDILKQREEIAAQRDKISEIAFELKKTNRTKNKFFSIIAHDLKNPFQGIIGFSELIKKQAEKDGLKEIEKFSDYIYDVSNQTYKLLDNLLHFTRSQIGLIKYTPERFNIKKTVEDGILLIQSNATAKGVKLINEIKNDVFVYADESMISTVVRNLITNAVKFTDKGGFVKLTSETKADEVFIKIIDNGIGIKEADIPKLFKADLNFSTFGTQNEKGTGLGLVVCKDFIVKNGGSVTVDSKVGEGSTFTISLPKNK